MEIGFLESFSPEIQFSTRRKSFPSLLTLFREVHVPFSYGKYGKGEFRMDWMDWIGQVIHEIKWNWIRRSKVVRPSSFVLRRVWFCGIVLVEFGQLLSFTSISTPEGQRSTAYFF